MEKNTSYAALFDFDGVIMDTESQYSVFWNKVGRDYLGQEDLDRRIKGQTLMQIFDGYFKGREEDQEKIRRDLYDFEARMSYEYLPGFVDFLSDLQRNNVRTAVVTSSNNKKMGNVYRAHPDFTSLFDAILTSEDFTCSKPDPECFVVAMSRLQCPPERSFVFEDSFHGLTAGRKSGASVIGLATTNPREEVQGKADVVWDDFSGKTWKGLLEELKG